MHRIPRIMVAGLSGDSGKTLLSCGLLSCFKNKGLHPAAFKKGPDYIDPSWLSIAAGGKARNLDTFLFDESSILQSFVENSKNSGISLIEANRGLFDGADYKGSHSSATLAKILDAPVVIIQDITKVTRTAAAVALGCKMLEPGLKIAGIVLNRYAGSRHLKVASQAIESETGIKVLGALPKLEGEEIFPSRHLGLVTPAEHTKAVAAIKAAEKVIDGYVDVEKVLEVARLAEPISFETRAPEKAILKKARIGYFFDRAFSFYYPENLEALEKSGAELKPLSSIEDKSLEGIDGLYIGGGFPETNAKAISENSAMMSEVKSASANGMPIYAECGGLIYLAQSLKNEEGVFLMSGIFPIEVQLERKPQGHGYQVVEIDSENPFFTCGTEVKGHEFHYTRISDYAGDIKTCMKVIRGEGCFDSRDGMLYKNTFGAYIHLHILTCPGWAERFVETAVGYKKSRI